MRRIGCVATLLAGLLVPAAAEDFPLGKEFKAVSISGFDVSRIGMTFKVTRDGNALKGSGHAGCNGWSATVVIRNDQIDLVDIVTTRKHCGAPRMKSEEAFLTSLRTAQRWRLDDKGRLVLEGDAARLLMTSATRSAPPAKKPKRG